MQIVLAGGTGFLGRPLHEALTAEGHGVTILTRHPTRRGLPAGAHVVGWNPDGNVGDWATAVDGVDAVVNLSGEPIAARRWSDAQKKRIRESRILAARSIVGAIQAASDPPRVLVNGSATGYYGPRAEEGLTERDAPGSDFLAETCVAWEAAASPAATDRTRVALLRTGIVLERDGGALAKMLPPFRLWMGGPIGSGRQHMSWIHRTDWIRLLRWTLETDAASGPVNATAPSPVTNAEFSKALARALGRPSWLPLPAGVLRVALGEMADALLLTGQSVVPERAVELGFAFRYSEVTAALDAIC